MNRAQESRSDNQGGFSNARNRVTRGDYNNLKNLVRLFETADQSTFMHEMSHFYLGQLEQIAAISPPDSQAAKDYATVKAWAEWHEGDAAAFEGTATAKEFAEREALIMEAKEKGFVEIDGCGRSGRCKIIRENILKTKDR